jgi:uncharacterized membrane protein
MKRTFRLKTPFFNITLENPSTANIVRWVVGVVLATLTIAVASIAVITEMWNYVARRHGFDTVGFWTTTFTAAIIYIVTAITSHKEQS